MLKHNHRVTLRALLAYKNLAWPKGLICSEKQNTTLSLHADPELELELG